MDNRPTEKKLTTQDELVRVQAGIIALELEERVFSPAFVRGPEDMEKFRRGISVFMDELETLHKYLQEAGG